MVGVEPRHGLAEPATSALAEEGPGDFEVTPGVLKIHRREITRPFQRSDAHERLRRIRIGMPRVLNFYWMFIGLVTGVYTFGIVGILLGPIVIGLLKAVFDTVTAQASWQLLDSDGVSATSEVLPAASDAR